MFWTDWVQRPSSRTAKIERANMDGTGRVVWVDTNIQWPNGLSTDYTADRIYWCDAYFDRIESISITNKDRRVRNAHQTQRFILLTHFGVFYNDCIKNFV
jgi:hypothetical protein